MGKTYSVFSRKAKDRVFKYIPLACLQRISRQRKCTSVAQDAHNRTAELLADFVRSVVRDSVGATRGRGKKTITSEDVRTGVNTARDRMNLKARPVVGI